MVKLINKGLDRYEFYEKLIVYEKESHFHEYDKNVYCEGPHITSSERLPWADEVRNLVAETRTRFMHGLSWHADGALRMEKEVISMVGGLLGNEGAVGNITTGGSESNACALLTALSRADKRGSVVFPKHAHYSFYKFCRMFGLEPIPVEPVQGTTCEVDIDKMRKAVRDDTIAIIGTAGTWPYGTIDPIDEMGEIAEERDLYFHVDACFGGFILPFLERCGYHKTGEIPKWDFRVKSVSSISADLHKNGHVPPPASSLLYADEELLDYAKMIAPPNGCFTGTRAASSFAASWAMLNLLGLDGYIAISRRSMDLKEAMERGVMKIPGLKVTPNSKINLTLAYSDEYNLDPVMGEMRRNGWTFGTNANPPGIVLCVYPQNDGQIEPFIADLERSMRLAESNRKT